MNEYRIIQLRAENYKALDAIDITPGKRGVQLSGPNGAGKTSVMDAIVEALAGKHAARPIRDGAEKCTIEVDLGGYRVTRTITGKTRKLVVENADGFKASSPQKILDDLVGKISFDPMGFSRMAPKEQRATVVGLVPALDFSDLDAARAGKYEMRTEVNRQLKREDAALQAERENLHRFTKWTDQELLDGEPVNVSDLLAERDEKKEKADKVLKDIEETKKRHQTAVARAREIKAEVQRVQDQITALQQHLEALSEEGLALDLDEPDMTGPYTELEGIGDQIRDLDQRIRDAEVWNDSMRSRDKILEHKKAAGHYTVEAQRYTDQIAAIDAEKEARLEAAEMPIDGLAVTDDGVTYQGTPFEDLADSQKLRVSFAIAMALNPKLRVVFVRDGSLLDSESEAAMFEMAEKKGFQVWIEKVDHTGKAGLIITTEEQ